MRYTTLTALAIKGSVWLRLVVNAMCTCQTRVCKFEETLWEPWEAWHWYWEVLFFLTEMRRIPHKLWNRQKIIRTARKKFSGKLFLLFRLDLPKSKFIAQWEFHVFFQSAGWSVTRYSQWLEDHTSEKERLTFIKYVNPVYTTFILIQRHRSRDPF